MSVYVIVDVDVIDPASYEDYKKMAAPTVAEFGGRYVVRGGKVEALEGEWRFGRLVILEFPTAERARAWWGSDSYRDAKALRHACAKTRMVLVEGM
jgi:uncharacterized protein (DUF1330 family)